MLSALLRINTTLFCVCFSGLVVAAPCYVIGDTSQNNPSKPLGSRQNPYGSLPEVQADATCGVITVLYSDTALEEGIVLRDGQSLIGKKGPGGVLPIITNSMSPPQGYGVILARDNQLRDLHIKETQNSAILGTPDAQPFGGSLDINGVLVTGANQAGEILDPALALASPSILLFATADIDTRIRNSEIGEADVTSVLIFQADGHGSVRVSNTTIRDQEQLSEDYELSPGIAALAQGDASLDVKVTNVEARNIGSAFISNSDGLLFLNQGSGEMNVEIDGYHYSNPDNGGWFGTSTGIEMGFFLSTGGGSFNGVVRNSVIEDAFFTGIQVLDQFSGGGNYLTAEVSSNEIVGTWDGIAAFLDNTPGSSMHVEMVGNLISPTQRFGIDSYGISVVADSGQVESIDAFIETNTIMNTQGVALLFARFGSVNSVRLDAGLGALASVGENRIIGTVGDDIVSLGLPVSAANNWWGSASGPTSVVELNGGTVDVYPFLTTDPN